MGATDVKDAKTSCSRCGERGHNKTTCLRREKQKEKQENNRRTFYEQAFKTTGLDGEEEVEDGGEDDMMSDETWYYDNKTFADVVNVNTNNGELSHSPKLSPSTMYFLQIR